MPVTSDSDQPTAEAVAAALRPRLDGRPGVTAVFLYGSAVDGGPSRDLDFAVYVDRSRVPSSGDVDLALALAAEFSEALARPADVVVIYYAPLA
ncbi:MAG: nucleotidyltransferase domain-containing protein, partial [Gemmatimonadetes bacterium]|nr:nucleotidyltransferase domain-containing protein [Gemmatimonadota bacterium]